MTTTGRRGRDGPGGVPQRDRPVPDRRHGHHHGAWRRAARHHRQRGRVAVDRPADAARLPEQAVRHSRRGRRGRRFVVNVLAADQAELAMHFASKSPEKFVRMEVRVEPARAAAPAGRDRDPRLPRWSPRSTAARTASSSAGRKPPSAGDAARRSAISAAASFRSNRRPETRARARPRRASAGPRRTAAPRTARSPAGHWRCGPRARRSPAAPGS